VLVAGIGVHAAWTRRTDTVPIIVAMSLIGFVGSAAIARFAAVEPEGEGRVLTREEADALESSRREGLDPDADRVAEADRVADDDREAGR
jgi:multicomponent Na+:H+ antiporter subunit F